MDEPARASLSIKLHRIYICNVCPAPFMTKSNGSHMLSLLEWHILWGIRPHGFCMPPKFYTQTKVVQDSSLGLRQTIAPNTRLVVGLQCRASKVKSAQQGPAISSNQWSLSGVSVQFGVKVCQNLSSVLISSLRLNRLKSIKQWDHLEASHLRVWASIPAGQALIFVLAIHRGCG